MSKLSTLLVAVRKISSPIPRSQFPEDKIEAIAQLILAVEGLINPLVLRRTSLESFEVISGHLEYYAAVRAREIDLRKGEMINAYVLEGENEEILEQQVELLRFVTNTENNSDSNNDGRLNNLENRLETRFKELQEQQKSLKLDLEKKLTELETRLPERVEPLAAFNQWDGDTLSKKLRKLGINTKQALTITEAIINERPFDSLTAIVDRVKIPRGNKTIKAINERKMLEIIDNW
ncbi:MAG: hypothetical protein EA365_00755 [Gloeocapsa sp. DLM2.Bin57]|nr:MAG: hypothetical protein EA365_00755 [Gloeocapsa sp. DLM2.Bin57]